MNIVHNVRTAQIFVRDDDGLVLEAKEMYNKLLKEDKIPMVPKKVKLSWLFDLVKYETIDYNTWINSQESK